MSISMYGPIDVRQIGEDAWECRGTPADCVLLVQHGALPFKADIVLSGINAGENCGTDLLYSATAGAARQGTMYCGRSIALSLAGQTKPYFWDEALDWFCANFDLLRGLCSPEVFVNVNMPNIKGMYFDGKLTRPSRRTYYDSVDMGERDDDGWSKCRMVLGEITTAPDPECDWAAVAEGKVSVSRIYTYPIADFGEKENKAPINCSESEGK
jgi:5'-nucleotidase